MKKSFAIAAALAAAVLGTIALTAHATTPTPGCQILNGGNGGVICTPPQKN